MATHAPNTSRRALLAGAAAVVPAAAAMMPSAALPAVAKPAPDACLLQLLAETSEAEAESCAAYDGDDADELKDEIASARLHAALKEMAGTPAQSWVGVAAKAARLCRSLRESGYAGEWGVTIMYVEAHLAESLAQDLARLAPEVRA